MKINRCTINESLIEPISGPPIGPEAGLASLIIDAINDEWETVDKYNGLVITARYEGFDVIASVLEEINTEESRHIGKLQELLKTVSPNVEAIADGEEEAEDYIDDDISWYED